MGIIAMSQSHQQMYLIPDQIRMLFCSHGHPYSEIKNEDMSGEEVTLDSGSYLEGKWLKRSSFRPLFICNQTRQQQGVLFGLDIKCQSWVSSLYSNSPTSMLPVVGNPENRGYLISLLAVKCYSDNDIKNTPRLSNFAKHEKERGKMFSKCLHNPIQSNILQ